MHRLAILVLAALLAGCTEPQDAPGVVDPVESSKVATTENQAVLVVGSPPPPLVPQTLALSDCQGFQTGIYAADSGGVESNPADWATGRPGARIVMEGWACNRISIGPYERGPVHMMLEYTDGISPPEACTSDAAVGYSLLSIGIDDQDIVDYLGGLAVPTYRMNASVTEQSLGVVSLHKWTWGPSGNPASQLQIVDDNNQVLAGRPTFRFFWGTASGAAAMDWKYEGTEPTIGERIATGLLEAPMHLAKLQPLYAGLGAWFKDTSMDGEFHYWGNRDCASA